DERDDGKAEALGDLHDAHRLHVALRIGHAELAVEPLLHVAALLVPDDRDRAPGELAEPCHERAGVGAAAVAVQLDPVLDEALHVVERVRAIRVTGELDRAPDRLVARVGLEPRQLALEPLALAHDADPAQERQPREAAQPLAQPDLLVALAHENNLNSFTSCSRCSARGTIAST